MDSELRDLFVSAEREMRPAFRAQLNALLDPDEVEQQAGDHIDWDQGQLIDVHTDVACDRGPWRAKAWLGMAAAIVIVGGLLVVSVTTSGDPPADTAVRPVTPPDPCALTATTVGIVTTTTSTVRVGLMPDGASFCLVDDADGTPLIAINPVNVVSADASSAEAPQVVERGVLETTAYYYVVAIPDGMPVASIRSFDGALHSFPTRVGRRFLVIDTAYDLRIANQPATRSLDLYSSSGVVVATIVDDPDSLGGDT